MSEQLKESGANLSDFVHLQEAVQGVWAQALKEIGVGVIHTVKTDGLFTAYLNAYPEAERQHHNCISCANFIRRFGGAVKINQDGTLTSLLWDVEKMALHDQFVAPIKALKDLVESRKVVKPLISDEVIWGNPVAGGFHHFAVASHRPIHGMINHMSANGGSAFLRDRANLFRQTVNLHYSLEDAQNLFNMMRSGALKGSEQFVDRAEWFLEVRTNIVNINATPVESDLLAKDVRLHNYYHYLSANAPAGFLEIKNSILGEVMDRAAAGMEFTAIKRFFEEKTDKKVYQRTVAGPSEGNIDQAEKLIENLGLATALKRRHATRDEITANAIWTKGEIARPAEGKREGVFGELRETVKKGDVLTPLKTPAVTMTFEKFLTTVMPRAKEIYTKIAPSRLPFSGILTQEDPEAKPILQWDHEDNRNPFSWFLLGDSGVYPSEVDLTPGWAPLLCVVWLPCHWKGDFAKYIKAPLFVLDGGTPPQASLCLFPEILRSELHGVRNTMENFSNNGRASGREHGELSHLFFSGVTLRVVDEVGTNEYVLDRLE